ncbi:MAG: 3-deoxy-D-manno-octulosonic acid kinase [Gammaproteobacteria bacterium]|nr:3-deoxy-D-manno-octulosonic acid kinase [Gammaproteobacteria bacterium]
MKTPTSAMLFNTDAGLSCSEELFGIEYWQKRHTARATDSGRGAAWFVRHEDDHLVLRHFRRGGMLQRLSGDRYLFTGLSRTRSFAEFRLLCEMWRRGLPVPEPVGARIHRHGVMYTADLLMGRITPAESWSGQLADTLDQPRLWAAIGRMIADFHAHGVCHADLNAHNILINPDERTWLIDFDKGSLQKATAYRWRQRNLARLQRSVEKLLRNAYSRADWRDNWSILQDAYSRRFMEWRHSSSV